MTVAVESEAVDKRVPATVGSAAFVGPGPLNHMHPCPKVSGSDNASPEQGL